MFWRARLAALTRTAVQQSRNASSTCTPTQGGGCHPSRSSSVLLSSDPSSLDVKVSDLNSRLDGIHLTASYLSGLPMSQMEMSLPSVLRPKDSIKCPTSESEKLKRELEMPTALRRVEINEPTKDLEKKKEISDPLSERNTPKYGQLGNRMLRIRKRKLKVHMRKKHKKKYRAADQKYMRMKNQKKETVFRMLLMDKINRAQKFDPSAYVDDYLEDVFKPLIPATYKGARHPEWFIKELILNEKLEKEKKVLRETNLITGEPLIQPGETVEQFVERMKKQ